MESTDGLGVKDRMKVDVRNLCKGDLRRQDTAVKKIRSVSAVHMQHCLTLITLSGLEVLKKNYYKNSSKIGIGSEFFLPFHKYDIPKMNYLFLLMFKRKIHMIIQ